MHFKKVDNRAHALYKKILNTFKMLNHCTSLRRPQPPIPVSVCEELLSPDDNIAALAPKHNYDVLTLYQPNFELKLYISFSKDTADSCEDMFL